MKRTRLLPLAVVLALAALGLLLFPSPDEPYGLRDRPISPLTSARQRVLSRITRVWQLLRARQPFAHRNRVLADVDWPTSWPHPFYTRGSNVLYADCLKSVLFFSDPLDNWYRLTGTSLVFQSTDRSAGSRSGYSLAFDAARCQAVLFGGIKHSQSGPCYELAETWVWNGKMWSMTKCNHTPEARGAACLTFHQASGRLVMFGGVSIRDRTLNDTWLFDGKDWSKTETNLSPPSREGAVSCYDSLRRRVIVFGGRFSEPDSGGTGLRGDTWEWDGSEWAERLTSCAPEPRDQSAMVYDEKRRCAVLFGGQARPMLHEGDERVYAADNSITDFVMTNRVPYRCLGDTWEWDGNTWRQRFPSNSPSGRDQHAMTYDVDRGVTILVGGVPGPSEPEVWSWDGINWTSER